MTENVLELTKKLVKIESYSEDEKQVCDFVFDYLKKLQLDVKKQQVDNSYNVIAFSGTPNIVLQSHLDTVPGEIKIEEKGEYLYGRGVCDTKGNVAAMICAAEKALKNGKTNFALVFTVGEETTLRGAKKIPELNWKPKKAIVGEPTSLFSYEGQKGIIDLKLDATGIMKHSSLIKKGESAIENLIDKIQKLRVLCEKEDQLLNIGVIEGGIKMNIVAPNASARISIRTTKPNKLLIEKMKKEVGDFEILHDLECVPGKNLFPGFTEAYYWKAKKVIVAGAGDFADAHTVNEKVKMSELEKIAEFYYNQIE